MGMLVIVFRSTAKIVVFSKTLLDISRSHYLLLNFAPKSMLVSDIEMNIHHSSIPRVKELTK